MHRRYGRKESSWTAHGSVASFRHCDEHFDVIHFWVYTPENLSCRSMRSHAGVCLFQHPLGNQDSSLEEHASKRRQVHVTECYENSHSQER